MTRDKGVSGRAYVYVFAYIHTNEKSLKEKENDNIKDIQVCILHRINVLSSDFFITEGIKFHIHIYIMVYVIRGIAMYKYLHYFLS